MLRINHTHWGDTHTHKASSLAEQHILCYCQCPRPLLTKHGICLAYGSSVGSSRQAHRHPLPSASLTSPQTLSFLFLISSFTVIISVLPYPLFTASHLEHLNSLLASLSFGGTSFLFTDNFASHLPSITLPQLPLPLYLTALLFSPWRETFLSFAT